MEGLEKELPEVFQSFLGPDFYKEGPGTYQERYQVWAKTRPGYLMPEKMVYWDNNEQVWCIIMFTQGSVKTTGAIGQDPEQVLADLVTQVLTGERT